MATLDSDGGADQAPIIRGCRGSLDFVRDEGDTVVLGGWVLTPFRPLSQVDAELCGIPLGRFELTSRPDLAAHFPMIPHAERSGFEVRAAKPASADLDSSLVLSYADGGEMFRFRTVLPAPVRDELTPPPQLMIRVSGVDNPEIFQRIGHQNAADFHAAIRASFPSERQLTVLDWGCGCGRVLPHLKARLPGARLAGSDVDLQAINWCRTAFPDIAFAAHQTAPPIPCAAETFDVVLGSSVFTHLDRQHQQQWIAEMHRILKPDGCLIASTHGRFAAAFFPQITAGLDDVGIVDSIRDTALDGVCPASYYRSVFQTPEFTRESLSQYFQMENYMEAGLTGFQDLFVARKRA